MIIAKSRDLNLHDVYAHELGPVPWSIATPYGTLYKAKKALVLDILEKDVVPMQNAPPGAVLIVDAFANIQILKQPILPGSDNRNNRKWNAKTFGNVAESILSTVCNVIKPQPMRIDFVVDTYHEHSI